MGIHAGSIFRENTVCDPVCDKMLPDSLSLITPRDRGKYVIVNVEKYFLLKIGIYIL